MQPAHINGSYSIINPLTRSGYQPTYVFSNESCRFSCKVYYMFCIDLKIYNHCFLMHCSPVAFLMEVNCLVCEVRTESVYQVHSLESQTVLCEVHITDAIPYFMLLVVDM